MFDLRLVPIAYGFGHVAGLYIALINALRRGTKLSDEASDLPLQVGLIFTAGYLVVLIRGLLLVS